MRRLFPASMDVTHTRCFPVAAWRAIGNLREASERDRRVFFKLLGYLFLCVALAAFVYDGTRILADQGALDFTSVLQHWQTLHPQNLERTRTSIEGVNPYLWSPLLMSVLVFPAWAVAGGLGIALYMLGYRRPRPTLPDGI